MKKQETNILVVIPARGGSKRLPGKNKKMLAEKPLIVYSIDYAKKNIKSDIIVSTDDKEIAQIAYDENVMVHDRPNDLSTDKTPTIDVLIDVLNSVNKQYDYVVLLQPTNPLRPASLFQDAWQFLQEKKATSLFTVGVNELKLGRVINNQFLPYNYQFGQRSQEMDQLYYENGLLYIANTTLINKGQLMNEESLAFPVKHIYSTVDIDNETDWKWASFLIQENE